MTPEECLVQYGRAWFAPDHAARVEALRKCCTDDVVFMDPQLGRLHGLDEVAKMIGDGIGEAFQSAPDADVKGSERGRSGGGVNVEVTTDIEVLHNFFRYSFVWTMPDGTRSGGTDFGEFADDGRMSLITVWPSTKGFPVT
ncbi:MAG: hypothetical protein QOG03_1429 [Actinomycetota bacterium]|jgi:hypothetical protein|nr:hypothetical protein [Actinomycetota bacterium]